ncbi:hypothetical protein ABBQ38_002363 [Trebouxia sp. C0009 RCD-2024]
MVLLAVHMALRAPTLMIKGTTLFSKTLADVSLDMIEVGFDMLLGEADKVVCKQLLYGSLSVDVVRTFRAAWLVQVEVPITLEDLAAVVSDAGLDLRPSPQDFAELPWLKPDRRLLLVKLQAMARRAMAQRLVMRQNSAAVHIQRSYRLFKARTAQEDPMKALLRLQGRRHRVTFATKWAAAMLAQDSLRSSLESAQAAGVALQQIVQDGAEEISRLTQEVAGLKKLLNLADRQRAADLLGMHDSGTLRHQVLLGTPGGESVKLASDQDMKPLQQLFNPAGAATVVSAISGPVQQSPCPPRPSAPYLSEGRVKEVATVMDEFIPGPIREKYKKTEQSLSGLGIERFTGVNPDKVYVVESYCLGMGGFGEVSGEHGCSSAEELEAAAEVEFRMQGKAWAGGVRHIAEPLGVYHAPNTQPPRSFILMRLAEGGDARQFARALHWRLPTGLRLLPDQMEWAVLRFAKSALQGLDELDRAGMALGDVKLENMMVDFAQFCGERGGGTLVKIVDFGFSTNAGESSEGGTSEYMAPEQLVWYLDERPVTIKGLPTHHQGLADVYGLGMSLWRLLVEKDPSRGAEDPLLRVLRCQGQTPEEDSDFAALKLKQQLMQHFKDAGQKAAVGHTFEADLKPFSTGLQDLISSMLVDEVSRKPAGVLLNHPILAHLPDL